MKNGWRAKHPAWSIVAVAVIVRLVFLLEYSVSPLMGYFGVDDLYYYAWAGEIASGDWLGRDVYEQGPLYAYLLALFRLLLGDRIVLILALQMLTGVAVALLVYDTGRRLFDSTTAFVAGLTAALFGPLVYYECMLMKSFLAPFLTMVALNAALRFGLERAPAARTHRSGSQWKVQVIWVWVAGVAIGLACLIQEYHLLLLLPVAAWIWTTGREATSVGKRAFRIAMLVSAALLSILPCTARNWVVAQELVLVTAGGGEVFYIAHGPEARPFYNPPDFVSGAAGQEHEDFRREASRRTGLDLSHGESSRFWFRKGLHAIVADPLRTVRLTFWKAVTMLNDYDIPDSQSYAANGRFVAAQRLLPSFGWVGGLGLVGMGLCLRSSARARLALGMVAAHTAPILIFYNFGRFRLGMMPLWILFAGYAGVWIFHGFRNTATRPLWRTMLAAVTAVAVSASMFYPLWDAQYRFPDSIKVALLAVRANDYALAEAELSEVLELLKRSRIDESLAVLDVAHFGHVWQMMAEICLRTGRPVEGLEHLRELRRLPARPDIRERNLKAAFMLSQKALRDERTASVPAHFAEVRAELSQICAELRELRPETVAFWAISAAHAQSRLEVEQLDRGLEAAWQNRVDATSLGWYLAGKAFLADFRGDRRAAGELARQALADMPNHPLEIELRLLAREQ